MIISLDWDLTYTEDYILWDIFINKAVERGHTVYIVTARPPDCEIDKAPLGIEKVFYTSGESKRPFMEKQGINIDVWIDDSPDMIVNASPWTKEQWNEWRVANGFVRLEAADGPDPIVI